MSTKVLNVKPSIAFDRFLKEICYGFIAFLITYLLDLSIGVISASDYRWIMPIIYALEHAIMKAFDEFDFDYPEEFVPIYKKVIDAGQEILRKIFKSKTTTKVVPG